MCVCVCVCVCVCDSVCVCVCVRALQLFLYKSVHIIPNYSGITCGRGSNGELCTQRLQKLIFLYLSTNCFVKSL